MREVGSFDIVHPQVAGGFEHPLVRSMYSQDVALSHVGVPIG